MLQITSTALSFIDSGLQPSSSYLYSVTALDASANESISSDILVTTLSAPVAVPPTTSGGGGGGGVSGMLLLLLAAVFQRRTRRYEPC